MNVKDVCLKKNAVRRKRMYVCPVKPIIENDSEKELQQQNANEMHQTSNDEKLQKADNKTALRSAKGSQTAEKAESEKRGLFHSPIFHITYIMRNICNQKTGLLSLPLSSSETRL